MVTSDEGTAGVTSFELIEALVDLNCCLLGADDGA